MTVALLGVFELLPDYQQRISDGYEPPSLSLAKLLGTDIFGRSVLFKILAGTKTAMLIGFLVTAISVPIGVVLGALSGYYERYYVDTAICLNCNSTKIVYDIELNDEFLEEASKFLNIPSSSIKRDIESLLNSITRNSN